MLSQGGQISVRVTIIRQKLTQSTRFLSQFLCLRVSVKAIKEIAQAVGEVLR